MFKTLGRLCAGLALLGAASAAQSTVLTFDNFHHTDYVTYQGNTVVESGFQLFNNCGNTGSCYIAWGDGVNNADDGGATLSHDWGGTTSFLTRAGGGSFDFYSIDLADVYDNGFGGVVEFLFTFADESTLLQSVSLDSALGLQTFVFNLTELVSVQFRGVSTEGGWLQFDNVVLDHEVPAPASLALLGLGLAALARRRQAA